MNAPKLVFHGTPVKPKATDLLFCCGYIIPALLDFRKKLDEDMEAFWFGLPTAAQFMIYFIVTSRYACPNLKKVRFPSAPDDEKDMYTPLVSTVDALQWSFLLCTTDLLHSLGPSSSIVCVPNFPSTSLPTSARGVTS